MKKILVLILALAMIVALAACGETKEAEVVENVDPNNNNIVIETPPAVVSGTDNNPGTYTPDTSLPSAAPTAVPTSAPTSAPPATAVPTAAPTATAAPDNNNNNNNNTITPSRDYKDYDATITQKEKDEGKVGYVVCKTGVNFRVGPGVEYRIIDGLENGTKVLVVGETTNGWLKIWYNNIVGYMAHNYISYTAPESEGTVVPDDPTPTPTPTEAPDDDPIIIEVP